MARRKHISIYTHLSANQVSIVVDGARLKVSAATSLRWRTLGEAFRGRASAVKEVFGWIAQREAERARRGARSRFSPILHQFDTPLLMDEALLALGIAIEDVGLSTPDKKYLRLQPWAVQLALDRKNLPELGLAQVRDLREQTFDAKSLRWPDATDV